MKIVQIWSHLIQNLEMYSFCSIQCNRHDYWPLQYDIKFLNNEASR
jgi:hypothetical protein